jgi:hypothetical protein
VRRDVRRRCAARALRAVARRTRAPPAHTAARPLRCVQRAAATAFTLAPVQNLVAARRDVQRCVDARAESAVGPPTHAAASTGLDAGDASCAAQQPRGGLQPRAPQANEHDRPCAATSGAQPSGERAQRTRDMRSTYKA